MTVAAAAQVDERRQTRGADRMAERAEPPRPAEAVGDDDRYRGVAVDTDRRAQCGGRGVPGAGLRALLPLLPRIVPVLGLALPRAVRGGLARNRVGFAPVPNAFAVVELYVDEKMRNHGIGGKLLGHAETLARGGWPRMCICGRKGVDKGTLSVTTSRRLKPGFVGEVPCSTYGGDLDLSHMAGSPLADRVARQAYVR